MLIPGGEMIHSQVQERYCIQRKEVHRIFFYSIQKGSKLITVVLSYNSTSVNSAVAKALLKSHLVRWPYLFTGQPHPARYPEAVLTGMPIASNKTPIFSNTTKFK